MVDVTILELNLEGAEFTANTPLSGERDGDGGTGRSIAGRLGRGSSSDDEAPGAGSDGDEGGFNPLVAAMAVAVTVLAVAIVRRLASGETEEERTEGRLRSIR